MRLSLLIAVLVLSGLSSFAQPPTIVRHLNEAYVNDPDSAFIVHHPELRSCAVLCPEGKSELRMYVGQLMLFTATSEFDYRKDDEGETVIFFNAEYHGADMFVEYHDTKGVKLYFANEEEYYMWFK